MKIQIGMDNFNGNFAGTVFIASVAEVAEIPERLRRACAITGYTLEKVAPKKRVRRAKKA